MRLAYSSFCHPACRAKGMAFPSLPLIPLLKNPL